MTLAGIAIGLLVALASFSLAARFSLARQVEMHASVAPEYLLSGAPSTLVLTWKNTSDRELRDATLSLEYPEHFLLEDLSRETINVPSGEIHLGTLLPQTSGSIKVRGVMFGDVGGEQTFTSRLQFRHGTSNRQATKITHHTFSPDASALTIDATLPTNLVSGQEVLGVVRITNTGPVDFREVSIMPTRSDFGFTLETDTWARASVQDEKIIWTIPGLPAGASTDIAFRGRAVETKEEGKHDWGFDALFTFSDRHYYQGTTRHVFHLIPAPVVVEVTPGRSVIHPGADLPIQIRVSNEADEPARNLTVFLEGTSPFFARRDGERTTYHSDTDTWSLDPGVSLLGPGEEIVLKGSLPVRQSIPVNTTNHYTELTGSVRGGVGLALKERDINVTVVSTPSMLSITSPIALQSFGRYSTPLGDQIGRGPLPPVVGEETRYWVFWTIDDTTNTLTNVELEGALPSYARFTGKQSVSTGSSVRLENGFVRWSHQTLPPTFPPDTGVVQIGFEIGVTPNDAQIGAPITLLDHIEFP